MKKILGVVAHPDDEVLGCGGTIAKFIKKKCEVKVLFLSDGESSRLKKVNKKKNLYRRASAIKAMRSRGVKKFSVNNFSEKTFLKQ